MRLFYILQLMALGAQTARAWSAEDHEIFRLRDEVAQAEGEDATFYSLIGVSPSATHDEIIKVHRRKAARMHPDKARQSFIANYGKPPKPKPGESKGDRKNTRKGPHVHKKPSQREIDAFTKDAAQRFARFSVVKDILTGPNRERYDFFLKNGFPKWRGTGYYYKRFRPGLGTVLVGLFIVLGGVAHYGAMMLGWKRQREFVQRYVKHARELAWGNSVFLPGLDSSGGSTGPAGASAGNGNGNGNGTAGENSALNRRQKRLQERENKKNAKKGVPAEEIGEPQEPRVISGPRGTKKRVVAENGKVLIVDSVGNVYLEETTDEGETHEYLLDVDEIPKPTFKDTVLVRLPVWVYRRSIGRFLNKSSEPVTADDEDVNGEDEALQTAAALNPNGEARKRRTKTKGKS